MTFQRNWWKHALDLPMAHDPGSRYVYCSANMNLMGAALTTATRNWPPELFERSVARPLQFGPHHWNQMPTDEGYLGGVWRGNHSGDAALNGRPGDGPSAAWGRTLYSENCTNSSTGAAFQVFST